MKIMTAGPLTKLDVQEAVDRLKEAGINPSIAAIRKQLGRGSMTTIQRFRRQMMETGQRAFPEPTADAQAAFQLIWLQAYAAAEKFYRTELLDARKQINSLITQNGQLSALLEKSDPKGLAAAIGTQSGQ